MSADYMKKQLNHKATFVRIGSSIFGKEIIIFTIFFLVQFYFFQVISFKSYTTFSFFIIFFEHE